MTDFERSYAVFTYYCGDLGFSNDATVGFSTGDGVYANHEATLNNSAESIACLNVPISPWVNVVYEISKLGKHNQLFLKVCTNGAFIAILFILILYYYGSTLYKNPVLICTCTDFNSLCLLKYLS